MGKGEIARNEQFLLFSTMFSTQADHCIPFVHIFATIILFAAELEESKIGISGKGLWLLKPLWDSGKPSFLPPMLLDHAMRPVSWV